MILLRVHRVSISLEKALRRGMAEGKRRRGGPCHGPLPSHRRQAHHATIEATQMQSRGCGGRMGGEFKTGLQVPFESLL